MTRVLLVRTGSVWWVDTRKASSVGEQNDATGVARMLRDLGFDVAITGRIEGELEGVTTLDWKWKEWGMPQDAYSCPASSVYACYDKALATIASWAPDVIVEISGAAPTMSTIDNHKGCKVFEFAVRYYGMALYMYHKLKLPRLVILNDPRSHPKDQEMTRWPECIPSAVLSQFPEDKTQVVDGKKYNVVCKYAGCENWWSWDWPYADLDNDRGRSMTIIAHSHMNDARLARNRDSVWEYILSDPRLEYKVFGKGWEFFSKYDPAVHRGPVKPDMVHELLQKTPCGPMIPIANGWVTAKLRQYLVNGALPLVYGRDPNAHLMYDRNCIHVPVDSWLRFDCSDELYDKWQRCIERVTERKELISAYRDYTKPDPSLLLDMISHFAAGGEKNLEKFGGYDVVGS